MRVDASSTNSYQSYSDYKDSGIGWLGKMPTHWALIRSRYIFTRKQRPVRKNDGVVTAFRDGQVTLRINRRVDGFTESVKEIGYQGVRKGDLLIHAMDGFAGAIGVSDSDGKCSPVCSVCVARTKIHMPYYGYLVRQLAVTNFITSLAKGIRERSTEFRYSDFSNLELAVPTTSEQETIAAFLDHETAKIDTLIEKQQQLIKLLKEKRQAVISHAVTKGLNPDAPMKDSGVEWLGEVPEHWTTAKLRYLVEESVAGPYGASLTKAMYTSEGYKVYGQQQVIAGDFMLGDYYISDQKYAEMTRYTVFPGDVLITVMGTIGRISVVPSDVEAGIINPRLVRYRFDSKRILPEFFKTQGQSTAYQNYLVQAAQGSTMDGLNMAILGRLTLAFPSIGEQRQILEVISDKCAQFDTLISKAVKSLALLKERRSALISAAVTGKIDVRNWKPQSSADKQQETAPEPVAIPATH